MQKYLLFVSLAILLSSCLKPKDETPKPYTYDDFAGTYTPYYTFSWKDSSSRAYQAYDTLPSTDFTDRYPVIKFGRPNGNFAMIFGTDTHSVYVGSWITGGDHYDFDFQIENFNFVRGTDTVLKGVDTTYHMEFRWDKNIRPFKLLCFKPTDSTFIYYRD